MSDPISKPPQLRVFTVGCLYDGTGGIFTHGELYIRDSMVAGILAADDMSAAANLLRADFASAEHIALPDGFLLPGLINSHHHFYSSLSRGLAAGGPFADFSDILKRLWWKLDRSLDLEAVAISARVAMLDGLRHGCTRIIDHHSSPSAIPGSLTAIAGEGKALNLTTVLCYEISDRNGEKLFEDALAENLDFHRSHQTDPDCRAMLGLHASFTLTDRSLTRIAKAKPTQLAVHVHAAEDLCDTRHAQELGFAGPVDRLRSYGLLDSRSLIVHGVYLSPSEIEFATSTGLRIAHNPESNCNNHVGYADPGRFRSDRILLGTDGMNPDMLGSLRFAYFLHSGFGKVKAAAPELFEKMLLRNPADYLSEIFGRRIGTIQTGDAADFAIFPYATPTPIDRGNCMAHILYALTNQSRATWVYANGRAMIEDSEFCGINESEVYAEARETSRRIWNRFQQLQD